MPGAGTGTNQGGKGRVESADSLNSSGSGGSDTLIPAIDEADGLIVGGSQGRPAFIFIWFYCCYREKISWK